MDMTFSTSGLKSLFRYPFQGKEWGRKLLYLSLFWLAGYFIPIIPWLLAGGYMAVIIRQVAAGELPEDLPEWQDWNRLLMDGLRMMGAALIFFLPLAALFAFAFSFYMGGMFAGIGLGESGDDFLAGLAMFSSITVLFCSIALGIFASLALGIAYSPALTHMVVKEKFSAIFAVREWLRVVRANLGGYLIALLIIWGLAFIMQMLAQLIMYSIILCIALPVLMFVGSPYMSVISAVLLGQVYKEGVDALAVVETETQ